MCARDFAEMRDAFIPHARLTHLQIVAGFNFIVNAPGLAGVSAAVVGAHHRHAGAAQVEVALAAADIVREELAIRYTACLLHLKEPNLKDAVKRTALICELFAAYIVCRAQSSWSVLEVHGSVLAGMRPGARERLAGAWALSVLVDTAPLHVAPKLFMKVCISGAVGCLAYCRSNARSDLFWCRNDRLFDNHGVLGALPPAARSRTTFGELEASVAPPGSIRVVFHELYVDAAYGATLERKGGVATVYAHIPGGTQLPELLAWTRANYEDMALILGGSPCEAMFMAEQSVSPGILNITPLAGMAGVALSKFEGETELVVYFRMCVPEEDRWFRRRVLC
jgi:hypothetical protein